MSTLRYTGVSGSTDRKLTLGVQGGTIDIASGATVLTLNNSISGAGVFTKVGPGQMDCTVAGSYSSGTIIRGGTLRLVSDSAFGSGTIVLNGTTNTATFRFGSDGQTLNVGKESLPVLDESLCYYDREVNIARALHLKVDGLSLEQLLIAAHAVGERRLALHF